VKGKSLKNIPGEVSDLSNRTSKTKRGTKHRLPKLKTSASTQRKGVIKPIPSLEERETHTSKTADSSGAKKKRSAATSSHKTGRKSPTKKGLLRREKRFGGERIGVSELDDLRLLVGLKLKNSGKACGGTLQNLRRDPNWGGTHRERSEASANTLDRLQKELPTIKIRTRKKGAIVNAIDLGEGENTVHASGSRHLGWEGRKQRPTS